MRGTSLPLTSGSLVKWLVPTSMVIHLGDDRLSHPRKAEATSSKGPFASRPLFDVVVFFDVNCVTPPLTMASPASPP